MSSLFLAIPLTLFILFVVPVWLWLHYSNRRSTGDLNASDSERLQRLTQQAQQMSERIHALEEILEAQHSDWRAS